MQGGKRRGALSIDWLTERLAVGASYPTEAVDRLVRHHRITHVVDVRAEACDEELALARHGVRFLHLPTEELCALPEAMLSEGVRWVRRALVPGRRVFIHCERGIGRGPLLALCVLVDRGMAPLEAMELAKEARAAIAPSPAQLRAFIAFARRCRLADETTTRSWLVPSFDALAAVAHRDLRSPDPVPPRPTADEVP